MLKHPLESYALLVSTATSRCAGRFHAPGNLESYALLVSTATSTMLKVSYPWVTLESYALLVSTATSWALLVKTITMASWRVMHF